MRRYGRNQRRRHRAIIAEQQRGLLAASLKVARAEGEVAALEHRINNWATNIRRIVTDFHPLNERLMKMPVPVGHDPRASFNFERRARLSIEQAQHIHTFDDYRCASTFIDMVVHQIRIEPELARLDAVTIRLTTNKDERTYFATDIAQLGQMRRDPRFILWIAEEIAVHLGLSPDAVRRVA